MTPAFVFLLSLSAAMVVWFVACCALIALRSRQAQNRRRSWLGKLLRVSHPEWQGKRVVMPRTEAARVADFMDEWNGPSPGVAPGVPALPRCDRPDLN